VKALIQDGQTPMLDGFTARSGRTYKGHIELDREEWKLKVRSAGWNEESASDIPEYDINSDPLGPCPLSCGFQAVETATEYICEQRLVKDDEAEVAEAAASEAERLAKIAADADGSGTKKKAARKRKPKKVEKCEFVFPRTVCKREITREEALVYLRDGKTDLLEDFTSRFGRPFSAMLALKKTGRHGFEFPPRKPRGGKAGEAGKKKKKKTRKKKTTKKTKTVKKKTTRKKTTRKKAVAKATSKSKKSVAKSSGSSNPPEE
jgi:DNA topoisomerase-3